MTLITLIAIKTKTGTVDIFKNGKLFTTFPSWHSGKPDCRYKYITLNCYRYRIEWQPAAARGTA